MSRALYRLLILAIAATGGFMGGTLSSSPPAQAVDCGNYRQQYFNAGTTWRGIKVSSPGMRVQDTAIGCYRLSLIYINNAAGTKQVRVGWYEAEIYLWNCPTTTERPRVHRVKMVSGTYTCDQTTHEYSVSETPTNDAFSVDDDNQDGIWDYLRNGGLIGTYDLGAFTNGILGAGTSRYAASGDSMYGNFDGLKRMGSDGSWNGWTSNSGAGDDPEYISCVHSSTWGEVKKGTCP